MMLGGAYRHDTRPSLLILLTPAVPALLAKGALQQNSWVRMAHFSSRRSSSLRVVTGGDAIWRLETRRRRSPGRRRCRYAIAELEHSQPPNHHGASDRGESTARPPALSRMPPGRRGNCRWPHLVELFGTNDSHQRVDPARLCRVPIHRKLWARRDL